MAPGAFAPAVPYTNSGRVHGAAAVWIVQEPIQSALLLRRPGDRKQAGPNPLGDGRSAGRLQIRGNAGLKQVFLIDRALANTEALPAPVRVPHTPRRQTGDVDIQA
jgi:hypothetical protein